MKMKSFFLLSLALGLVAGCVQPTPGTDEGADGFSFAFLTDIHLQPELHAVDGFRKAIDTLNQLGPDFILTGGDLVMDVLNQSPGRADTLYGLYKKTVAGFTMPVYHTVGNHEVYGWHRNEESLEDDPLFGKGMFEDRLGKRYYSFDHKGWHFMVLDGIDRSEEGRYMGRIDEEQVAWIRTELEKTDKETPIVLVSHIPFITSLTQLKEGSMEANPRGLVLENAQEVLQLFMQHKLRLVLQGHLHYVESISVYDRIHFVTGGAVSGHWWDNQPGDPLEEGFLLLQTRGDQVSWEYVDYGWIPPHTLVSGPE